MKKYTYDAFISYRHAELDKFVAENLHKMMEAFRLPGNVSKTKTEGRTRIERVFRDKEELPLTSNLEDPIMQALQNSDYLIVICSPRLKESLWCRKEIETFIGMHGREKVLAVLIEGEPHESFPEELLYVNETVLKTDGTTEAVKKPVEPLAADVRGKNKREMLKAMRTEILRLLAPMFAVGFDDLRQRHRERRMRRILTASLTGAAVCLAIGAASTAMALRIHNQKEQIEAQNYEIQAKTSEIQLQNQRLAEIQAQNLAEESARQLAEGDRIGAINTAVSALTEYEGIAMPYTAEAQYALTESLRVYDDGGSIKAMFQMETAGVIEFMKVSPNCLYLLTYDGSGTLTLWNTETGAKLKEIIREESYWVSEHSVAFLGNDKFVYDAEDGIVIYDIEKQTIDTIAGDEYGYSPSGFYADETGENLLVTYPDRLVILETGSYEKLAEYVPTEDRKLGYYYFMEPSGTFAAFEEVLIDEDGFTTGENVFRIWDFAGGTFREEIPMGAYNVKTVNCEAATAYVMMNYYSVDELSGSILLMACNPATGEILWEKVYDNCYGNDLYVSPAEGADSLLLVGSFEAYVLSSQDGSIEATISLGDSVAGGATYLNREAYILFTRDGEYYYVDGEKGNSFLFAGLFQSPSEDVKQFMVVYDGFAVLPYSAGRVIVCEYSAGEGLTVCAGELPGYTEGLSYADAVNYAKEMGLPKAQLAKYLFFDNDLCLTGVFYSDDTLEIYNSNDNAKVGSIEANGVEIDRFLGTDEAGNIYLSGYKDGFMLSPEYEVLAKIEGLVQVDKNNNRLILKDSAALYTVPIYTMEELLAIAQPYVLR